MSLSFAFSGLPLRERSRKGNIFLWGLAVDAHDNQLHDILEEFVTDLKRCEGPFWLSLADGEAILIQVRLLCFYGDTPVNCKAAGCKSPSAKHPCWRCTMARKDFWNEDGTGIQRDTALVKKAERGIRLSATQAEKEQVKRNFGFT